MSPIAQTTGLPPIEWPQVTVGGKTYTVKYSQLSEYKISQWGCNIAEIATILDPTKSEDPRRFSFTVQLWAASVAHEFKPPQVAPSPEQWMTTIPDDDLDLWKQIAKAVMVSLIKALSERRMKAGPAPTVEAQPAQPTPVQ